LKKFALACSIFEIRKHLGMESKELLFFLDACRRGEAADVIKMCELFPELINESDNKGFTPLIIAAYNNQAEVIAILLHAGADNTIGDRNGNTALMGAIFKGYDAVANMLLDAGADPNVQNGQGATALTFAATFHRNQVAQRLLQAGADKSIADIFGKTPLDHARVQDNEALVLILEAY
jgi:ankyrin repeat protein